jgi:hypothetical protein
MKLPLIFSFSPKSSLFNPFTSIPAPPLAVALAGPGPPFVCLAALFSSPCSTTASGVAVRPGLETRGFQAGPSALTLEAGRPRGPHCSEPIGIGWCHSSALRGVISRWELVPGRLLRICRGCVLLVLHVFPFPSFKNRSFHRRRERDSDKSRGAFRSGA